MPRSLKKGPFVDQRLIEKIKKSGPDSKEIIKTWKRSCTIVPEMIGFSFGVYNGKNFITVKVSEEMVGHKLGEFSPTTKFGKHGGKMQKELESKEVEKEAVKIGEVKKTETKPTK
ncbi:MAG: 30S ribosomal protein S19 [Parcubacteria group bacterium]